MSKYTRKNDSQIDANQIIDYRNIELLTSLITNEGKILPRRLTRLTVKQQRQLSKAVKRARTLKLLSYTSNNRN